MSLTERYSLLKTSWYYQARQFFENSSLHGVRYIDEPRRPFCEKLMWFCVTSVGGVATLVIIVSLWEKFQTNPTITGLDTDFHNWDVAFPAIAVCPFEPANRTIVDQLVRSKWPSLDPEKSLRVGALLVALANLSWPNLATFSEFERDVQLLEPDADLRDLAEQVRVQCEDVVTQCSFKGDDYPCCSTSNVTSFTALETEIGFCFAFNSRHTTKPDSDTPFRLKLIYETDEKWQLAFQLERLVEIDEAVTDPPEYQLFIQSNDELPTLGIDPQHVYDMSIGHVSFGAKQTYTTEDARQLSIRQRRCVFPDEIQLVTDEIYTYTACMSQCRMMRARKLCKCVPFFYKPTVGFRTCNLAGLICLSKNIDAVVRMEGCDCELGCHNTVYEVEKLLDKKKTEDNPVLEIAFISWPMVRYKREVLFGWVDLLVSFGGIAGLFLGFSLLSGVELLYYFSMRACCMVYRNAADLRKLQLEYAAVERPPLDLSLTPFFMREKSAQSTPPIMRAQRSEFIRVAPFTIRPLRPLASYNIEYLP